MTHFTNPGTGFSKHAQEALTRDIAPNIAEVVLENLRKTGELTNEDEKATKERLNILANLEPGMRERIEKDHSNHTELFKRIGKDVPTLSEYAAVRPDIYTVIADIHNQMESEGKEPNVVFYPINLPLRQYVVIAKNMTKDKTIPNNPLEPNDGGLWIDYWPEENHDELQKQDEQYLQNLGTTIVKKDSSTSTTTNSGHTTDTLRWGVAVLPATDKPQALGKSYDDINGETCTRSQYLSLQFSRIQAGLPPVDQDTRTWFHGKVDDSSPNGSFDRDYGQVAARDGYSDYRYPHIGCRPPGVG